MASATVSATATMEKKGGHGQRHRSESRPWDVRRIGSTFDRMLTRIVPHLFLSGFSLFSSAHTIFYITCGDSVFLPSSFPTPTIILTSISSLFQNDCPSQHPHRCRRRDSPPQGCRCPRHGSLLPPSCAQFRHLSFRTPSNAFTFSASLKPISKCSTASQKANTPLVSVRSTWPGQMTVKTSTPSR